MDLKDKFKHFVKGYNPDEILQYNLENNFTNSVKRNVVSLLKSNINIEGLKEFFESIDKIIRYGYVYTVEIINPNFIDLDEYTQIRHKFDLDDKALSELLTYKGINGIEYDMNTRGCSDKDFSDEKNIVIMDDTIIKVIKREKKIFEGYMKIKGY